MVRLNKESPENIAKSARYFNDLVPDDSVLADSAAVMLLIYVKDISAAANQKLYEDTANYFNLAYGGGEPLSEKEKTLKRHLEANHLYLQGDGEGGAFVALDYDWLTAVVQSKTSAAVDGYFTLLSKEEKTPAILDAALAVEMKELIERIIETERLGILTLPYHFSEDVLAKNKVYIAALLFGSDNSPSLEYNSLLLTPEFKEGYAYLLATYPSSKAAKKVKEWLTVVKSKDEKKIQGMRQAAYQ